MSASQSRIRPAVPALSGGPGAQPAAAPAMLAVLTAAAFVIFAQIFMVAPILPTLARAFATTPAVVGLAVPAYLIPYGAMTLVWGPVSDRLGRRPVILVSLAAFTALTALTALAPTAGVFLGMRLVTAVGASGLVPIALAFIGEQVPYARRGRTLGWIFGGMAGDMAFGAAAGALAEPLLGWSGLFLAVATAGLILLAAALVLHALPATPRPAAPPPVRAVAERPHLVVSDSVISVSVHWSEPGFEERSAWTWPPPGAARRRAHSVSRTTRGTSPPGGARSATAAVGVAGG